MSEVWIGEMMVLFASATETALRSEIARLTEENRELRKGPTEESLRRCITELRGFNRDLEASRILLWEENAALKSERDKPRGAAAVSGSGGGGLSRLVSANKPGEVITVTVTGAGSAPIPSYDHLTGDNLDRFCAIPGFGPRFPGESDVELRKRLQDALFGSDVKSEDPRSSILARAFAFDKPLDGYARR